MIARIRSISLTIAAMAVLPAAWAQVPGAPGLPPSSVVCETLAATALSPDGERVAAVVGLDIVVYDASTGAEVRRLTGHLAGPINIAWAPGGHHIASCSYDDSVRLWDAETGQQLLLLAQTGQDFEGVAVSPDGDLIAATNDDMCVWLLQADGQGQPRKLASETGAYQSGVAFSPDGRSLASAGGGAVCLWDVASGTRRAKTDSTDLRVVYSPRGDLLATWGTIGVNLRNAEDGAIIRTLASALSASFSPSGALVATAMGGVDVAVWDPSTGDLLVRLPHDQPATPLAFERGTDKVTCYATPKLVEWDLASLSDPAKREEYRAFADGENDHYARFIRGYFPGGGQLDLPYMGPRAGLVVTRVVDKAGNSVEITGVSIGNTSLAYAGAALPMKVGATQLQAALKKINTVDILDVKPDSAHVRVALQDGTTTEADMMVSSLVTGSNTFGPVSIGLSEVAQMGFDSSQADQQAETLPPPEDAPFPAEVVDSERVTTVASDIRLGGASFHALPIYLGSAQVTIGLKFITGIEVAAAPQGGVIARVSLVGGKTLVGFIPFTSLTTVSGTTGLGDFSVPLANVRSITLR